jgi:flagellar hook assembly protein FlgD
LQVYDVAGRLVRTLVDGPVGQGIREAVWNGRDERGREVASGAYICRMESNISSHSTKMVLLR